GRRSPCVSEMTPMRSRGVSRWRGREAINREAPPRPRDPLRPYARLLPPRRVAVALLERVGGRLQRFAVAGGLVSRHAGPVLRFGRGVGGEKVAHDLVEPLRRLLELPGGECRVSEAEMQLRQEVVIRQKAFDAMALAAVGI